MIDLKEMSARVLAELEEAGQEHVPAMLNTVAAMTGDAEEKMQYADALAMLVRDDLIKLAYECDRQGRLVPLPKDEALAAVSRLAVSLLFGTNDGLWTWVGSRRPDILITSAGRTQAKELLEERGYSWWRII